MEIVDAARNWLSSYSGDLSKDIEAQQLICNYLLQIASSSLSASSQTMEQPYSAELLETVHETSDMLHCMLSSVGGHCYCCETSAILHQDELERRDWELAVALEDEDVERLDDTNMHSETIVQNIRQQSRVRQRNLANQPGDEYSLQNDLMDLLENYSKVTDLEDIDDDQLISMFLDTDISATRSGRKRLPSDSLTTTGGVKRSRTNVPKAPKQLIQLTAEQKRDRLGYLMKQTEDCLDRLRTQLNERSANVREQDESRKSKIIPIANLEQKLQLKDYQETGVKWILAQYQIEVSCILADEMGLGKTMQAITVLRSIGEFESGRSHVSLIVIPLSTVSAWVMAFKDWFPRACVIVYHGKPEVRKEQLQILIDKLRISKLDGQEVSNIVVLTTYDMSIRDQHPLSRIDWDILVVDEAHRLKNNKSRLFTVLSSLNVSFKLLLTGTPLQNNLEELWSLLNFILPTVFRSTSDFIKWFNSPFEDDAVEVEPTVITEEEKAVIVQRLQEIIRPFVLRRLKENVLKDLPDCIERVIPCPMSGMQVRLYSFLQKSGRKHIEKKFNTIWMQLRKVCSHPYLFRNFQIYPDLSEGDEPLVTLSGKFWMMHQILQRLACLNHRCLIFFQFTSTMDLFEDFLSFIGFGGVYLRFDGKIRDSEEREALLNRFNAKNSTDTIFMISTRCGGVGLNLQSADTVILFDSDWNPQVDLQSQSRAHRIGQTQDVLVLRLVTLETIEERILEKARGKLDMEFKILRTANFNQLPIECLESSSDVDSFDREQLLEIPIWSRNIDLRAFLSPQKISEIVSRNSEETAILHTKSADFVSMRLQEDSGLDIPQWFLEGTGK